MKNRTIRYGALIAALVLLCAMPALAITAPTTGSFAYSVYDIAVVKILQGPIGFVAGLAGIVFAAVLAVKAMILPAALAILGAGVLIKADAIVTSLGMLI
jgi:hypothetical protein